MDELTGVLIRKAGAQTPHAYDGLAADVPWRISGVLTASDGSRRVAEIGFNSREEATTFAESEFGLTGRWDDPDGDGNYCIVGEK
ncbi:MAG: hypothetical protein ABI948_07960 [Thermoleophilia bacterium]